MPNEGAGKVRLGLRLLSRFENVANRSETSQSSFAQTACSRVGGLKDSIPCHPLATHRLVKAVSIQGETSAISPHDG